LKTSYKEDIKASVAELVYGITLRIPGEYFAYEEPSGCPQMFVEKFRKHMRAVGPVSTAHHIKPKPFIYKDLNFEIGNLNSRVCTFLIPPLLRIFLDYRIQLSAFSYDRVI